MKRRFVVGLSCALAVAALASGGAQTPQQQRPVFRAGTVFVSVDTYPRRDGKVVEGLTKNDFEIFEDGKPQAVEEFEFIRVDPVTPDADRRDPTSVADGERQAADPHNRVFVVYLDLFNTSLEGARYSRGPITEFLTRAIGPTDLFAVMTPELPVTGLTFARRADTLEAELSKYWYWSDGPDRTAVMARSPHESRLLSCGIDDGPALVLAYRLDLTVSSVEQMIARLGALRDERKNILFISEGWALTRGMPGTSRSKRPSIPTIGVGPNGRLGTGSNSNASGYTDTAWCDSQYATYAGIDYQFRFREMVNTATRANVAFYPIDVGGLRTPNLPASVAIPAGANPIQVAENYRARQTSRIEMLHDLAVATNGTAVTNTNNLVAGVRRIADDLSAFYLLGYYSSNTAADGKFRRIEVKMKTPGIKVSARPGYLAPTEKMRKAEAEAAARPVKETTAVDLEFGRLSRLRTDARVYTTSVASAASLDVIVEIASGEFSSGQWKDGGAIRIEALPGETGAKPVVAEGKIDPGLRSGVVRIPVATNGAGGWRVRVRVTGGGDPLEDDFNVAASAPSLLGEAAVYRAGTGARSPLRPVADFKFYRTERLHAEWSTSKPLDGRTARLLDRRGEPLPVPVTLTERTDGDRTVLAADLVLGPLADGDYVIEVSASAGADKVQRLLAFRVVR